MNLYGQAASPIEVTPYSLHLWVGFTVLVLVTLALDSDVAVERHTKVHELAVDKSAQPYANDCFRISSAIKLVMLELEYLEERARQNGG